MGLLKDVERIPQQSWKDVDLDVRISAPAP
jgi:hypothetical protein